VKHVQRQLPASERRVCGVLGQARATQRYKAAQGARQGVDQAIVARMHELVRLHPRRGYPRAPTLIETGTENGGRSASRRGDRSFSSRKAIVNFMPGVPT
jgi:hypothetical protein